MKTHPIKEVAFYSFEGKRWALFIHVNGDSERYRYYNPTEKSARRLTNLVNVHTTYTRTPALSIVALFGSDPGWKVRALK